MNHHHFSLSALFVATYFAALCFNRNLLATTAVLTAEPIIVWMMVTVLMSGLPRAILRASQDNCYRMDGSKSDRRTDLERHAIHTMRWDLYFVMFALVVSSHVLYFIVEGLGWINFLSLDDPSPKRLVALVAATLGWLVICGVVVRRTYLHSLATLHLGITTRAKLNLEADVEAIQMQFEKEQNSIA